MAELKRLKSITEIYEKKRDILQFEDEWKEHIGCPEIRGVWSVHGHSGNGKTSYLTQMARMLTKFGKVWYASFEEGNSESFKQACKRVGMEAVKKDFHLLEYEPFESLMQRLKRRNRPRFLFLDSLQVMQINKGQFIEFERFCTDTGIQPIIIMHSEGKKPEGRLGKFVEYMAFIKIRVHGFKALVVASRYGGIEPYVIYAKRAAEFWGDIK